MKLYKRAAALILTAATLLSLVPPVSAADDHVTVSSAKEFYALVQSCTRDVWSQGGHRGAYRRFGPERL